MTHYDLVVLGTGSGNTIVDDRFAGWKVAIVERDRYGGTCLNRGCIPSKMLILPADAAQTAAESGHLDVHATLDGVEWRALRDRVFGRTDDASDQGRAYREQQDGVDALTGTARFTGRDTDGPWRLAVEQAGHRTEAEEAGHGRHETTLTTDRVVVAVGGRPVIPDIPGLADADPYTSDDVMRIEELPRRLGILGGGYIGCELAHVFASFGVEVVQIESEDTLLGQVDEQVAAVFTAAARRRWDVRLETELEAVERSDAGLVLRLDDGSTAEVDAILVAAGRRPNTDWLDLDGTGIETDEQGRIVVDGHQRTSAENVWALGDCTDGVPLKHAANEDARVIQHNLLAAERGEELASSRHENVPQAVFSSPQVASIGLTEAQAREQAREQGDLDVVVACQEYSVAAWGWALDADEEGWLCKLVADRATGHLVGAHLVGPQAATLIHLLIPLVVQRTPVSGYARAQHWIHPAPAEVVEQTLLALEDELGKGS